MTQWLQFWPPKYDQKWPWWVSSGNSTAPGAANQHPPADEITNLFCYMVWWTSNNISHPLSGVVPPPKKKHVQDLGQKKKNGRNSNASQKNWGPPPFNPMASHGFPPNFIMSNGFLQEALEFETNDPWWSRTVADLLMAGLDNYLAFQIPCKCIYL